MKKFMTVLLICLSLVSTLAASGTEESEKNENSISFICSAGGSGRSFEGGLNRFITANEGKVDVSIDMIALASLPDQLMTQFVSGTAFYDAIAVNSVWQASMVNFLLPLNEYIGRDNLDVDALYGAQMDAITYDGNVIGLPVRTGTDVLYYRTDMLAEAGLEVPHDIQSLLEAARAMTKGPEDNRDVYGFAFMAQDPFFCTNALADLLYPEGIYFLNEEMTAPCEDLLTEDATEVFAVLLQMYKENLMPNPMSWTYDDSIVAFQENRLAMTFDDFMRAPTVESEDSGSRGLLGYASYQPEPSGSNAPRARGGWWILSIDKNSQNPDLAWEFIKYMCSYETQEYMANEWSNGPSILSLLDDETFNSVNKAAKAAYENYFVLGVRDPISIVAREELATAIQETMHDLFLERIVPEEVGPAMYEKFENILSRY